MIIIKRPIVTILVGTIIGIVYGLYFEKGIAINIVLLALFIFLIKKRKTKTNKYNKTLYKITFFLRKRKKVILLILISIIISNLYTILINTKYENTYKKFPKEIETKATIISEAEETEYNYKYNIKIKSKKFILYTKKKDFQKIKYGAQINLKGEYTEPQSARNYKGFNYKEYLKTKKIYGSITASKIDVIKENNVNIISKASNDVRNKVIETAQKILPEESYNLLIGILIGKKDGITEETIEAFSKSSLSHILAISGTHITYVILGITFLLNNSRIHKKIKYVITIICLILFMFITQFTPSVVRACIMAIIILFSKIVHRKQDFWTSVSVSLLIIIINNPFAIKDIGLQLSYLGAIGIVVFSKSISLFLKKFINEKIANPLAVTIAAQIMVLPITIENFNIISTVFIISNILAVPIVGIIILLGYLNIIIGIISLNLGKFIGIFTNKFIKILMFIAEYTAKIPFASLTVITPNIISIVIYYIAIYAMCNKKMITIIKQKIKKLYTYKYYLCFVILGIIIINILPQSMKIHMVDVGQRRLHIS